MIPTNMLSAAQRDDTELVTASLAGDRDAFGQIVSRYQALICSLAYSATGSVRQSEDLAQETFVNAWQNLGQLRETSKLRSWLCGILRHRISSKVLGFGTSARSAMGERDTLMETDLAPVARPFGCRQLAEQRLISLALAASSQSSTASPSIR